MIEKGKISDTWMYWKRKQGSKWLCSLDKALSTEYKKVWQSTNKKWNLGNPRGTIVFASFLMARNICSLQFGNDSQGLVRGTLLFGEAYCGQRG